MLNKIGGEEEYIKIKNETKLFILIKNYDGGSFKFLNDIFDIYDNNYNIIDKVEEIDNIKETDYLIINY